MAAASGFRGYYFNYRPKTGGPARAYAIGPVGDLSYKEARAKAEELRGLVVSGRDPMGEKVTTRKAVEHEAATLRAAFAYYLLANRSNLDPHTVAGYEQTMAVLPARLMESPAEEVTPALYREAVRSVTKAPVSANRYLSRIKAVVRFAHAEGKLQRLPPIIGMRRPHPERKRDRVLSADEIRDLWPALDAALARLPRAGRSFAAATKIMLLCGTRLGETLAATWSQFSLDGAEPLWRLPAQARKGTKISKSGLLVPLAPLVVEILQEHRSLTGAHERVFHKFSYDGRTYAMPVLLEQMRKAGHGEHWTPHALRRSCSSWLGELGCPTEVNDLILGHARKGIIAHYDHSLRLQERRQWLARWADKVASLAKLSSPAPTVHLYTSADGLPEMRPTREPNKGRRYVGEFTRAEAAVKVAELLRE